MSERDQGFGASSHNLYRARQNRHGNQGVEGVVDFRLSECSAPWPGGAAAQSTAPADVRGRKSGFKPTSASINGDVVTA